jgi:hypothetical protein
MDTRFWGPSGWAFLHQITFAYSHHQKKVVQELFETLPYILPCKFCRASLSGYLRKDPLEPALESQRSLSRWLWTIHNRVSAKLREQGETMGPDPTFESVESFYKDSLKSGCTETYFPGWDFLFSIAENHPLSRDAKNSTPISGAPVRNPGMSDAELNEWNLLEPEELFVYYKRFWAAIGDSLPYREWRELWAKAVRKTGFLKELGNRASLRKALWKIRCMIEEEFELLNRTKFAHLCQILVENRSGCTRSSRSKTCRAMSPRSRTQTRRHR